MNRELRKSDAMTAKDIIKAREKLNKAVIPNTDRMIYNIGTGEMITIPREKA